MGEFRGGWIWVVKPDLHWVLVDLGGSSRNWVSLEVDLGVLSLIYMGFKSI